MSTIGPPSELRGATAARCSARGLAISLVAAVALHVTLASGDEGTPTEPPPATASPSASTSASPSASVPWGTGGGGDTRAGLDPFPSTGHYLSYGFSFHSESLLAAGNMCRLANEQCVLGAGGGLSFSGALRTPHYSLGAVYEASFHDSNNIYQRGVLQQLRGELRFRPRFTVLAESINSFVGAGAGIAGYGDNWSVATLGAGGHGSLGVEYNLDVKVSAVLAVSYRAIYFRAFEDPSRQYRPAGLVHMLGLQLGLELHEPL